MEFIKAINIDIILGEGNLLNICLKKLQKTIKVYMDIWMK